MMRSNPPNQTYWRGLMRSAWRGVVVSGVAWHGEIGDERTRQRERERCVANGEREI